MKPWPPAQWHAQPGAENFVKRGHAASVQALRPGNYAAIFQVCMFVTADTVFVHKTGPLPAPAITAPIYFSASFVGNQSQE
jgi:hypothetical protein